MTSIRPLMVIMLAILSLSLFTPILASSWSVYPYAENYRRACLMGDQLYLLKGNTLLLADAETWQVQQMLSREEGLSESDINDIVYSSAARRLAIIYNDGLIDVLHPDGTIWTITDLYSAPMEGFDKTINSVREQEGWLFISTAFGFVVIDLYNEVLRHTINLERPVRCAWSFNGDWYYSDNSGSYYCPKSGNPYNPNAWQMSCDHAIIQAIVLHGAGKEQCWQVSKDLSLRKIEINSRTSTRCTNSKTANSIQQLGRYILVMGTDSLALYDTTKGSCPSSSRAPVAGQRFACRPSSSYLKATSVCPLNADSLQLVFVHATDGFEADSLHLTDNKFSIHAMHQQKLQVDNKQQSGIINRLVGGVNGEVGMSYVSATVKGYKHQMATSGFLTTVNTGTGQWQNYGPTVVSSQITEEGHKRFVGLLDFIADPNHDERYWFSTLEEGIIGIDHGQFLQRYYKYNTNGGLDNYATGCTRVAGLALSPAGDLWCINDGVTKILRVHEASADKWYGFQIVGLENTYGFTHLLHTRHGGRHQIWGCQEFKYNNSSVFCYDYGTDIRHSNDDRQVNFLTHRPTDAPPFIPHYGRGIFEGPDGTIWLLNTSGLFAIDQPDSIFAHPGQMRTVLSDIIPTAIVADSEDHLWVSTEQNGLYLLTTDGREQLEHFTSENSMLPSDEVLSLAFDTPQHTLWIATEGQLLSYAYDANQYGGAPADWISTAWCHPGSIPSGPHATVQVFGLTDDTEVIVQNGQGRTVIRTQAWGNHATLDADCLPHGTYTVIGTDSQGHQGTLTTFCIE